MSHHIIKMCVKRDTHPNMDITMWLGPILKGVRLHVHCLISISIFENKWNGFANCELRKLTCCCFVLVNIQMCKLQNHNAKQAHLVNSKYNYEVRERIIRIQRLCCNGMHVYGWVCWLRCNWLRYQKFGVHNHVHCVHAFLPSNICVEPTYMRMNFKLLNQNGTAAHRDEITASHSLAYAAS